MVAQDHPDFTAAVTPAQIVDQVTDEFAVIAAAGGGTSTLVAAVPGRAIVVRAMAFSISADDLVTFQSDGGPTDLFGPTPVAERGGFVLPYNASGWFRTLAGEALDVDIAGTADIGGALVYGLV